MVCVIFHLLFIRIPHSKRFQQDRDFKPLSTQVLVMEVALDAVF